MLISLWTGRKPTKRTYEMICFYLTGWASERELLAHIEKLKRHDAQTSAVQASNRRRSLLRAEQASSCVIRPTWSRFTLVKNPLITLSV